MLRIARDAAAILAACTILFAVSWQTAKAHSWYDPACCSTRDCAPVPPGSVEASPAGWRIRETGEVVPYGDPKERLSKDSDFHVCRHPPTALGGKANALICLYVPGMGS